VPTGFSASLFADGLQNPREMKIAPNGDIFVAESRADRIRVLRGTDKAQQSEVFATGLNSPFGIAFYPPGPDPQYVYIANTNSIVRFPYKNGDIKASGPPETIVSDIPSGTGHWTRDIAFSPDGKLMYVAVGSGSASGDDRSVSRSPRTARSSLARMATARSGASAIPANTPTRSSRLKAASSYVIPGLVPGIHEDDRVKTSEDDSFGSVRGRLYRFPDVAWLGGWRKGSVLRNCREIVLRATPRSNLLVNSTLIPAARTRFVCICHIGTPFIGVPIVAQTEDVVNVLLLDSNI
jgi:DNA-binding beta-propeller fold protein YncE